MNIRFSVFIAASLDGFIARTNGKLDWLNDAADKNSQEDYGYQNYLSSVDCIVMGRRSFEKASLFPEWPYVGKRVLILSKSLKQIPTDFEDKVSLYGDTVEQLAVELQSYGYKHVYVDGGVTIQSFIRAELLDEITLTQIPVLLGKGLPLFSEVTKDVKLKLQHSKAYSTGFVQSKYLVKRYSAKYYD